MAATTPALAEQLMGPLLALIVGVLLVDFYLRFIVNQPSIFSRFKALFLDAGPPNYFELTGVPAPKPLLNFDVDTAKPRPYRPFRWGYHQTMALKKLEPDYWLELESTYRERVEQRKRLYAENGKKLLDCLPGSEPACKELMEMVIQFLCARYPKQFRHDGRNGKFWNGILREEYDTKTIDPLIFLLNNVPEDFLLVEENEKTGLYEMRAGVACSALGWNVAEKIGRPMKEIHGAVPDYKKIEFSVDRFFTKLACDKPIQRGSWGLEIGQPVFLQPDDPHWRLRDIQKPDLRVEEIYLRVDWQTLRRLPRSNAIVFNYKVLFTPMTQFREEPFIPRLVAKVIREGNSGILNYKGTAHIAHKALPALDTWAQEQEEKGWVSKDWNVRTLDEDPFFPGWNGDAMSKDREVA
ncbi:hypothetical protein HGRIS_013478 [Hohenbuehelia grisea]|uniref:Uncharacterized protein n=1 Tax=Hohenbuehelia grisea TaxID=104357 RepID=A0ABR3IVM1_9AGAR